MNNPLQMIQMLQASPAALLKRAGLNVPANLTNPQEIVEHLTRTGQISQERLNQAQQMANQFKSNAQWK